MICRRAKGNLSIAYPGGVHEVTLKQLRALAAVVAEGTYAGAGTRLHVTAPAVAQQVRLLERRIGIPLFEFVDGSRRPTDAGIELLATTERVEAELDGCARTLQLIRDSQAGTVSFGAVSTAKYFAPQLLAGFRHRRPGIDVRLVVGNRDDILARLASNDVDVVVMGRPPEQLDLVTEIIGEHPSVVVASPGHPLGGRRGIALSDLGQQRFLIREVGSGTRLLTERLFGSAGIDPPIAMEIASNETIKQAVMADLGIAVISAHTVAAELRDGRLVTLDVVGMPVLRQWHAVRRSSRRPTPAARQFWRFLVRWGGRYLPAAFG